MVHVYFLRSQLRPDKTYVGFTELDPHQRLAVHNQQRVPSNGPLRALEFAGLCGRPGTANGTWAGALLQVRFRPCLLAQTVHLISAAIRCVLEIARRHAFQSP